MRTFDKETYQAAKAAWDAGEFGHEWREARSISWERGYPYPPSGTRWDDPEDGEETQRAIIFRALDYRPFGTLHVIRTSNSWHQVVERIIAEEHRLKETADDLEWEADAEKGRRPSYREATSTIADVLRRIGDSAGNA